MSIHEKTISKLSQSPWSWVFTHIKYIILKCNLHFLQIMINIRFTSPIGKNLLFNGHHREVM